MPLHGDDELTGDDTDGDDTLCEAILCDDNQYVKEHECVLCQEGTTNLRGDNASGNNTYCDNISTNDLQKLVIKSPVECSWVKPSESLSSNYSNIEIIEPFSVSQSDDEPVIIHTNVEGNDRNEEQLVCRRVEKPPEEGQTLDNQFVIEYYT